MTDPVLPHVSAGAAQPSVPSPAGETAPQVPLMDPRRVYGEWGPAAEKAILAILRSHTYVKGPHVAALEQEFADHTGVRYAVAVDSCTDALFLVLRAVFDARPAACREVILPTFTFVATAGAVVNAGGIPIFADVCPETHNLDPEAVAQRISEKTAAVLPVHLFGNPVDMDAIRESTAARGIFVLEDAAQAIDATWKGRRVGALGDAGTFSFYPSKNLAAAGDGGIVTTDDPDLAGAVAALRDHGQNRKLYDHDRVGTNSRMDEIQAAVVRIKLPRVEAWTQERRAIAARYDLAFQGTPCRPQRVLPGGESAYHLYTVRVPDRDAVREALEAMGIGTGIYYPFPLHRQTCFARYDATACPVADDLAREVVSLPCFPGLTREEQAAVIKAVREVVRG